MIQWRKIISFDFYHIPKLSIGFNSFGDAILLNFWFLEADAILVSWTWSQAQKCHSFAQRMQQNRKGEKKYIESDKFHYNYKYILNNDLRNCCESKCNTAKLVKFLQLAKLLMFGWANSACVQRYLLLGVTCTYTVILWLLSHNFSINKDWIKKIKKILLLLNINKMLINLNTF